MATELKIENIRADGDLQPRTQLDGVTIAEYADDMRRGDVFPPVRVVHDGENYWLYDGFHRVQAARQIARDTIRAEVKQGTKRDAEWESLAANKDHGLRRSQKDKRRVIKRALKGWAQKKSDRQIARHVGCSNRTVGKYRKELESTVQITQSDKREGADGRVIDTTNIGTSKKSNQTPSTSDDTDKKERYTCETCGEEFGAAVWHCPACGHHWNHDTDTCKNCESTGEAVSGSISTEDRLQMRKERKREYRETVERKPLTFDRTFGVIYADPPWSYDRDILDEYGDAGRHYDTMDLEDIKALPVVDLAAKDCALFLWVTSPKLPEGLGVLNAWGFNYKTSFVWDKVGHNHGHYNSVRHEFLLIGGRGSSTPENSKLYDSVQSIHKSNVHSEKPSEFRALIDTLYPSAEKIELFAREEPAADKWTGWGDQA